jgi:hypothetical protein
MTQATIKTAAELIAAANTEPTAQIYWRQGNRPAAPGAYTMKVGGQEFRVYSAAFDAANKKGLIRCIRNDWASKVYRIAGVAA